MRGQPGHSRAALALRCSRQRVCISAPMFHVSVERVIYVCMNIGGGVVVVAHTAGFGQSQSTAAERMGRGNK